MKLLAGKSYLMIILVLVIYICLLWVALGLASVSRPEMPAQVFSSLGAAAFRTGPQSWPAVHPHVSAPAPSVLS